MASIFSTAANKAINDQPRALRYKGSLLIVASGVVWILGELARDAQMIESGLAPTLGVIATIAAFFLNRFTRDGITPSMAKRLEQAGAAAHMDRVSLSSVGDVSLPIYDGLSTVDEGGRHRAED